MSHHHHHHHHHRHLGVTCTQGTCVLNPRHKMWSCVVETDTPRSVRAWRAQRLVPREKPGLPCRWPQLWHIGIRSVLLWVTLPCVGLRKRCSCGEPLPHTLALWCSFSLTHTHMQTNKLSVSGDVYLHLWIQRKNKPPSESNIWPASDGAPLLGSNWYSNTGGPVAWMFFAPPFLSFTPQLYQDPLLHNFQFCIVFVFFFRGWCGSCLCQVWIPRTIGKDEFSSIANHKTPFLFMHVGRRTTNSCLSVTLEEWIFPLEWEGEEIKKWRSGKTKILYTLRGNIRQWQQQQNTYQNNSRLAAKHGGRIKWKREE